MGNICRKCSFPPPAALEVHRVVHSISVGFRAGLCSSAGKTVWPAADWLMAVHSSFLLLHFAVWLLELGLKISSSLKLPVTHFACLAATCFPGLPLERCSPELLLLPHLDAGAMHC